MGRQLTLDNILSSAFFFADKWSSGLSGNRARDLLRFLVCRLYDQGRGQLTGATVTLAQGTIAKKIGISGKWCWELCQRLQKAGWIEYTAPRLPDGMRASCTFAIGRQFRRLLVMLLKSRKPKKRQKSVMNDQWKFSPSKEEKKLLSIREKENEPPPERLLAKIPLLRQWLKRGNPDISSQEPPEGSNREEQ
jgi:hypothetical protein